MYLYVKYVKSYILNKMLTYKFMYIIYLWYNHQWKYIYVKPHKFIVNFEGYFNVYILI